MYQYVLVRTGAYQSVRFQALKFQAAHVSQDFCSSFPSSPHWLVTPIVLWKHVLHRSPAIPDRQCGLVQGSSCARTTSVTPCQPIQAKSVHGEAHAGHNHPWFQGVCSAIARAKPPHPALWVATKNCPAAPILVLWGSLTDPEAVCTVGWSGGNAYGPQPQPFFRVLEHNRDRVSDTVLLVARLKWRPCCRKGTARLPLMWTGDLVPLEQLGQPPPKDVRHRTSGRRYRMLTSWYDIARHVWHIRCRIRYDTYDIVCHVHTPSKVHLGHTTSYILTICLNDNQRCRTPCQTRCRTYT